MLFTPFGLLVLGFFLTITLFYFIIYFHIKKVKTPLTTAIADHIIKNDAECYTDEGKRLKTKISGLKSSEGAKIKSTSLTDEEINNGYKLKLQIIPQFRLHGGGWLG